MRCALLLLPLWLRLGAAGPDGGAAAAGAPRGCPGSSRELAEGARCDPERLATCEYAAASCACEPSQCVTPAGPIPGCVSTFGWHCRRDGCRARPKAGRCPSEGKACSYDDGLCGSEVTCQGGVWVAGRPSCRPAARPPR